MKFGRLGFLDTTVSFSVSFGKRSAKNGTTTSCRVPKLLIIAFITYSFSSEPGMFKHANRFFNRSAANGDKSFPFTLEMNFVIEKKMYTRQL